MRSAVVRHLLLIAFSIGVGLAGGASAASTELVSIDAEGQPVDGYFASMSADGRFVAFASADRVLVRDRVTRTTIPITDAAGMRSLAISVTGRHVAFTAFHGEPLCEPSGHWGRVATDAQVADLDTGLTTRVGQMCTPGGGPISISADGRFVLTNLLGGILDRQTGQVTPTVVHDRLSADGRVAAGRRWVPFIEVVAVQDRVTGDVEDVSDSAGGPVGLSADGRFVAFTTGFQSTTLPIAFRRGIFVRDRQRSTTDLVSVASDGSGPNGDSALPAISAGGQVVAFLSGATNLATGGGDCALNVFAHDRRTGVTSRVNVAEDGILSGCPSDGTPPSVSADGRFVAFESDRRVYVRDRGPTVASFVADLYEDALGRAPDPGGREGWEAFLGGHCAAGGFAAAATGFFDSAEYRSRALTLTGLVETLYRALLGRSADPGGLDAFTGTFRRGRIAMAVGGFLPSPEFRTLLPNRTDPAAVTAVVTRLYSELLGRAPDSGGLAGWVGYVTATGDLESAVAAFVGSPELEERALTFADFVRRLYRSLLARDPDPAGLLAWEGTLRAGLQQVIAGHFLPSPEFRSRSATICGN